MEAKYKYLVIGVLLGIFLSGLFIVLIGSQKNTGNTSNKAISDLSQIQTLPESDVCMNNQSADLSEVIKIDLNYSTIEMLNSLPGIGEVKAKSIVDFREKYGNFVAVDELLYVPGIGDNLFQQICNLVSVDPEENE